MSETPRALTGGRLLARNVALNVAGGALPVIAAISCVPPLARAMGESRFGVLLLAWTTLGYFSLFDLGIGRALTQAVANQLGMAMGSREISRTTWTALVLAVPVGVLGAVALWAGSPWLAQDALRVPGELQAETTLAFRILAIAIPFTVITAVLRGLLEAMQRFGWVNALRTPYGLITYLGPVAALPFSTSLVPAVAAITIGRVALAIAHAIVCARVIPEFRDARPSVASSRSLLRFGGWMTLSNLVSPLMNTLDRFIIGGVIAVDAVAYYATPHELATKMWMFTAATLPVFFPAFATSAVVDQARTGLLFDRSLRVIFAALFLPTAMLVILAPEILTVWVGPRFATEGAMVLRVLAIAVFVNTLGQAALTLIQSMGRPDLTGKYHLVELPMYAALMWYLLPRFGILGVAFAWALRAVVDAVLLLATCPALLPSARMPVARIATWLTLATPAVAASAFLPSIGARLTLSGVLLVAWPIIAWRALLTPEERLTPRRVLGIARISD